jgi:outer membrane receptor for ferrienterochelin and colicins
MRSLAVFLICCCAFTPLPAQQLRQITGSVTVDGHPLPKARVTITPIRSSTEEPPRTTHTTPSGTFTFTSLTSTRYTLRVSALGYRPVERIVVFTNTITENITVELTSHPTPTDTIVISGTRGESYIAPSPVKVQVITSQALERNVTNNLMDAVQAINGLMQQIDCGVCYTNNIRINGMEGPYTAVLIDGMPIIGALASVYGLNGINPSLIDRLEIIKGPSSTLYGSEAMGGAINVITKDPRFTPRWTIDTYRSSRQEQNVELAVSPRTNALSSLLSASFYNMPQFIDRNGDNFSDAPIGHRFALFGKLTYQPNTSTPLFSLSAKFYDEDRFGGVREWKKSDRGSSTVYGESIRTRRAEVLGTQSLDPIIKGAALQFSLSTHHQDSYYGATSFRATHVIGHSNLLFNRTVHPRHTLLAGASLRYNAYRDNTPVQMGKQQRIIPGLFVEDEFTVTPDLTLLAGTRLDYHKLHGSVLAPRLSAKWDVGSHTVVRLNAGIGFRVVNLFTEDHAALSGTRQVVIDETLRPERSASLALNVNHIIEFGVNNMMIDFDAFHTRFSNKIVPNYDIDPNLIVYRNLDGHAVTRGVALAFNQNFLKIPFLYAVGITLQDVYTKNSEGRANEFFAPRFKGNFTASYTFTRPGLSLDYTGIVTGPMRLPEYDPPFQRPTQSPIHSVHHLQATYALSQERSIYVAVKNLFNYTQGSPLIDPQNPFGPNFDTNYVWGPIQGRYLLIGLRMSGKPKKTPPVQSTRTKRLARTVFHCLGC